jgi:hypothetical protein
VEQNVRDDLQSLGYVLLHLAGVKLPWSGVKRSSDRKRSYYQITKLKLTFDVWQATRSLPAPISDALAEYMLYVSSLPFHVWPDYSYLMNIFRPLSKEFDGQLKINTVGALG